MLAALLLGPALAGCEEHRRIAIDQYPPGTLHVRYVKALEYTDCLVAAAVMCANYVTGSTRFDADDLRREVLASGGDPSRVADVSRYLADHRVTMQALKGEPTHEPLVGLGWWVLEGGYPVACVINEFGANADYNHAVVVIGVDGAADLTRAEGLYVLDPASPRRVERLDRLTFLHYWGSAGNVMLPVFETPPERVSAARHSAVASGVLR